MICTATGSTGKERDAETGLDYFRARYFSGAQERFTTPDPVTIAEQKLLDPQQWNMFSYGRNNPLRFVDPTGRLVELPRDEKEREKVLAALNAGVGEKAAAYIGVAQKKGHYYVSISDSKAFAGANAVSAKLGGIIGDQNRTATIRFESPGTNIGGRVIGLADRGMSPGLTASLPTMANVRITSGSLGILPTNLVEGGQRRTLILSEVLIHELGHVDSDWYHSVAESNSVAVRLENQVRQIEGDAPQDRA